jgi:hypothetical protein
MRYTQLALVCPLLFATPARADVAPPSGYTEKCTLEKKTTPTSECVQCQAIREGYPNADRCTSLLSPYCYVLVCGAWGGVSYPEIWCRTKGSSNPAVPQDIQSQLNGSSAAVASSTPPTTAACLPYTPPPESSGDSGGGCNTTPRDRATFSWAIIVLGMAWTAFFLLRRRTSTAHRPKHEPRSS